MAAFSKGPTGFKPSPSVKDPGNEHKIGPIQAGTYEAIAAGDACYIRTDGRVAKSISTSLAAGQVHGFAQKDYPNVGEPITLYHGVPMSYGLSSATPGTKLYVSGSVAGALDTATTATYGLQIAAIVTQTFPDEGTPHAEILTYQILQ